MFVKQIKTFLIKLKHHLIHRVHDHLPGHRDFSSFRPLGVTANSDDWTATLITRGRRLRWPERKQGHSEDLNTTKTSIHSVFYTVPVEEVDVWNVLRVFRKKIWFSVHAIQDSVDCCSWKETQIWNPTLPANNCRAASCHLTSVIPMKVSARLMDWEEIAILKPRPSAGMMVDWQMKLSTELTNWTESLWSSLLDTSVTLSVQIAALFPCSRHANSMKMICQLLWLRLIFPCSFFITLSHRGDRPACGKMWFVLTLRINLQNKIKKLPVCIVAGIFNEVWWKYSHKTQHL